MLDTAMRVTAPPQIREPEDLAFLSAAPDGEPLEIDLTDVEWISPLGVVAVLATCLRADNASLDATVYLPESRETRTYLARIGLLDELARYGWTFTNAGHVEHRIAEGGRHGWTDYVGIDIDPLTGLTSLTGNMLPDQVTVLDIGIDPNISIGPHLPVSRLTTMREVEIAAERLEDALWEWPAVYRGLFDELLTVAVELTANAREHGSECYAVAQAHSGQRSGTPGVHIAVADFGQGLAQTLREHYGEMPDGEAIVHAFTEQVSGTGLSERGFGLTQIAEIIDRDPKNVLHIVSQAGHAVRSGSRFEATENEALRFHGTLASAYLFAPPPSL